MKMPKLYASSHLTLQNGCQILNQHDENFGDRFSQKVNRKSAKSREGD